MAKIILQFRNKSDVIVVDTQHIQVLNDAKKKLKDVCTTGVSKKGNLIVIPKSDAEKKLIHEVLSQHASDHPTKFSYDDSWIKSEIRMTSGKSNSTRTTTPGGGGGGSAAASVSVPGKSAGGGAGLHDVPSAIAPRSDLLRDIYAHFQALWSQNLFERAMESVESSATVIDMVRSSSSMHVVLLKGILCLQRGDLEHAKRGFTEYLSSSAQEYPFPSLFAWTLLKSGQVPEAKNFLEKALGVQADPSVKLCFEAFQDKVDQVKGADNISKLVFLANIYRCNFFWHQRAKKLLEKALQIAQSLGRDLGAMGWFEYFAVLFERREDAEALKIFERLNVLNDGRYCFTALVVSARLLQLANRHEEAQPRFERALSIPQLPTTRVRFWCPPECMALLAKNFILKGQASKVDVLVQKLRAFRRDVDVSYALAVIESSKRNYDVAIGEYDKALSMEANHIWSLIGRGQAYLKLEDFSKAYSDFQSAVSQLLAEDYYINYDQRGEPSPERTPLYDAAMKGLMAARTGLNTGKAYKLIHEGFEDVIVEVGVEEVMTASEAPTSTSVPAAGPVAGPSSAPSAPGHAASLAGLFGSVPAAGAGAGSSSASAGNKVTVELTTLRK